MTEKSPNPARVKKVQELRRSNAATPVPSKKVYTRKKKHSKGANRASLEPQALVDPFGILGYWRRRGDHDNNHWSSVRRPLPIYGR